MNICSLTKILVLAAMSCTALWATQASAKTDVDRATLNQLQQQVQRLQQRVIYLEKKEDAQETKQKLFTSASQEEETAEEKKLANFSIHGGIEGIYSLYDGDNHGRATGGDLSFSDLQLGAKGAFGDGITYDFEHRFTSGNNYLHYGWAAYAFDDNDSSQVKGGYIQVPFGNLRYGYTSFWGSARYY